MNLLTFISQIKFELPVVSSEVYSPAALNKAKWRLIWLMLIVLSLGAWAFYFNQGLTLAYNDARSHLNVARRVVDSLQPGLAQIGSVWLPLYHVLELPLIWNDYLWHSGIAGSVVSMISFVLGGVFLVKIASRLKFDLPATLLTLGVYVLNPNLLFLQTAPMTESLLIFLALGSAYYLIKWAQTGILTSLIFAAFFTFLSTLARYDGWFQLVLMGLAVAFISLKKRGVKFAEGNFLLFATMAGFGVFLWLLWNLVIFHDPLYFALGEFSAKAQQDILVAQGRLITRGNLIYSIFVYLFAVRHNLGTWVSLASVVGWGIFAKSKNYAQGVKIAVATILTPLVFNIVSLFVGHSVIHLPELPPYTWFNDRYGLMMLPAAAIALGALVNGRKIAIILAAILLLVQTQIMYLGNRVITIEDGVRGASGEYLDDAGVWLMQNVSQGLVLVAASSNDALLFRPGLPLKRFITEGARIHWDESMQDPTQHATWIVMHKGDLVEKSLRSNPLFLNNYRLVYHDDFSFIYKLDLNASEPLSQEQLP